MKVCYILKLDLSTKTIHFVIVIVFRDGHRIEILEGRKQFKIKKIVNIYAKIDFWKSKLICFVIKIYKRLSLLMKVMEEIDKYDYMFF